MEQLHDVHGQRQHLRGVFKADQDLPGKQEAGGAVGSLGGNGLRHQGKGMILQELLKHAQGGNIVHVAPLDAAADFVDMLFFGHALQIQNIHARGDAAAHAHLLADEGGRAHDAAHEHHVVAQRFGKGLLRPLDGDLGTGALHAALDKAFYVKKQRALHAVADKDGIAAVYAGNYLAKVHGMPRAADGEDVIQQYIGGGIFSRGAQAGQQHIVLHLDIVGQPVQVVQRRAFFISVKARSTASSQVGMRMAQRISC